MPPKAGDKRKRSASPRSEKKVEMDPDLPMDPTTGIIYHLACTRDDIADRIILVGDPGRVPIVAKSFDKKSIIFDGMHRELRIITGTYKHVPVTVMSTGMGTDNVEIVVNEIHALKEYDHRSGKWADGKANGKIPRLSLIRVGTCGSPRKDIHVGALAITSHAIGMDNTGQYYVNDTLSKAGKDLHKIANHKTQGLGEIGVYTTDASPRLRDALCLAAKDVGRESIVGITASGSGFYGCQARAIGRFRGKLRMPDLVERLGNMRLPIARGQDERVVNIEMETSSLTCLSSILGYEASAVCAVIAVRQGNYRAFLAGEGAAQAIADAITVALNAIIADA